MKSILRRSGNLCIAVFACLGLVNPASARSWRRTPPPPKPVYTAIGSVDRAAMTITTVPKNSTGTAPRTYHFTAQTKVSVGGQPGTLGDLKPGQRIRVGLGASADVAEELFVTSPPRGAKEKPKRGQRRTR